MKKWFGQPDDSSTDFSPCSNVTMSYWFGGGLVVGHRRSDRTVMVTGVLQATAQSTKHGEINGGPLRVSRSAIRRLG